MAAVEDGLAFLAGRQLGSGQFPTRMGQRLESGADGHFDSSPFATALIVHSLGFSSEPVAREMVKRALGFLRAEMEDPGVWRYWTTDHPGYANLPPDADDTACVSHALRSHGVPFPDNRGLLLANRDRHRRFYTWFAPRWRPPPANRAFWRVAARQLRSPARHFWKLNNLSPDDVACVVNANVVLYLGDGPDTRAAGDHLVELIRRGDEDDCDQWYRSRFALYYAVSKCAHAGIEPLRAVAGEIARRIAAAANPDGSIGGNPLQTALAACALHNCGGSPAELERACGFLVSAQSASGGWPIAPFYHGGPPENYRWGSEELTTGFCLEALIRLAASARGAR